MRLTKIKRKVSGNSAISAINGNNGNGVDNCAKKKVLKSRRKLKKTSRSIKNDKDIKTPKSHKLHKLTRKKKKPKTYVEKKGSFDTPMDTTRKKLPKIVKIPAVQKVRKYKKHRCDYIFPDGRRCKQNATGKGTLCISHGGIKRVKENIIPVVAEKSSLIRCKFNPSIHPIKFIELSREGMSDVEIAAHFEVSTATIRKWSEKYESFSTAYEIGKALHESWYLTKGKDNLNTRSFNTQLYKFLTSNKLGYSDKMETKNTSLNVHGVLMVPDAVTEDEWESEDIIDVDS